MTDPNDRPEQDQPEAIDRWWERDERWWESDVPPAWFDPTYAGERWDDDY